MRVAEPPGYHVHLVIDPGETDVLSRDLSGTVALRSLERLTPTRLPAGVLVYPLGGTEAPPATVARD